jgi:hypothetical protein
VGADNCNREHQAQACRNTSFHYTLSQD